MTGNNTEQSDFDFDEMARLAQDNPEMFEQRRQQLLEEVIEQASPELQRRMHGLQWQIDQIREKASNPISACIRISKMMWDSVLEEDGLLENLQRLQNGDIGNSNQKKTKATVISLHDNMPNND